MNGKKLCEVTRRIRVEGIATTCKQRDTVELRYFEDFRADLNWKHLVKGEKRCGWCGELSSAAGRRRRSWILCCLH
jgi:hypothetical protein